MGWRICMTHNLLGVPEGLKIWWGLSLKIELKVKEIFLSQWLSFKWKMKIQNSVGKIAPLHRSSGTPVSYIAPYNV